MTPETRLDNIASPVWKSQGFASEEDYQQYLDYEAEPDVPDEETYEAQAAAHAEYLTKISKPLPVNLIRLHGQFRKWLAIEDIDKDVIDFVLAVYISNRVQGTDPIWAMIVGPSSGGKSELLRTLTEQKDAYFMSKPTPNSLVSGWRGRKEDPSQLRKIDGKVVIIPDFAPVLTLHPEKRNELLGMLRDAYDGRFRLNKGNLEDEIISSRFSFLTAVTTEIDSMGDAVSDLGERYIRIRLRGESRTDKALQSAKNMGSLKQMRAELISSVKTFLESLDLPNSEPQIPIGQKQRVAHLADQVSWARSPVHRDRYSREIDHVNQPEEGGRLTHQLLTLLYALVPVRGREICNEIDYQLIKRVAEDSIPPNRLKVFRSLKKRNGCVTPKDVVSDSALPEGISRRTLEDLEALEILKSEKSTGKSTVFSWRKIPFLEN
jgi:hypothetical protein